MGTDSGIHQPHNIEKDLGLFGWGEANPLFDTGDPVQICRIQELGQLSGGTENFVGAEFEHRHERICQCL